MLAQTDGRVVGFSKSLYDLVEKQNVPFLSSAKGT